ncbi:unnamed protein product, partial [Phaeothamnion confervicola]
SIHLFREKGFYPADLAAVIAGYKAAMAPSLAPPTFDGFSASAAAGGGEGKGAAGGGPPGVGGGMAGASVGGDPFPRLVVPGEAEPRKSQDALARLTALGVEVYNKEANDGVDWECLAGYDRMKREIEDTVVLALKHPETYDQIARETRRRFESNRPRAVLFEGPPGTGKTLSARVIASRLSDNVMIHVSVESVMSKWYGESEKKLSQIFEACDEIGGAIIFIDEIDALATSRSSGNMHEATRRVLSVLLQKAGCVDGFIGKSRSTLICATNRKQDLDPALVSRFDLQVRFELPNSDARAAVFDRYAKHLSEAELKQLAASSRGVSCRDIKEVCELAERRWASKLIRKEETTLVPPFVEYTEALAAR